MRTVLAVVLGLAVVHPARGLAQATGTPSELADDALTVALWHIAATTQTRIGFESVEVLRQHFSMKDVPTFPVASRDEALDAAVAANPRYEWRAIGDVVVVRPSGAWSNASNPLNRRVRSLRVHDTTESGALAGLRALIYTDRFDALPNAGKPVAFDVQSGTILDAFNQLIQSADDILWHAAYRPNAHAGQRSPNHDLQLQLWDATVQRAGSLSYQPRTTTIKQEK